MLNVSKKIIAFLFLSFVMTIHAHIEENAKVAELAFHRLERLVLLKKIDPSFQSKYINLEFINLEPQNIEDPHYKAILKQTPDKDNKVSTLILLMDQEGKTLSHDVKLMTLINEAPAWSDKDPVTLSENALHFVEEEEAKGNTDIIPFYEGLNRMTISQFNDQGTIKARVSIESSKSTKVLEVILNMDGTYSKYSIK